MSWAASLPEPAETADAIKADNFTVSPPQLDDGPRAQFEAAIEAAANLAQEVDGPLRVSLSGHSNAEGDTGAPETIAVQLLEVRGTPA